MSRDAESDFFEEFVAKAKADAMAPGFTGSFFSYGPGGVVQASGNVHVSLAGPVVIEGIARFDELSISGNCLFKTGSSLLMNNGSDPILHSEHYWSITNLRENIPQMKSEV